MAATQVLATGKSAQFADQIEVTLATSRLAYVNAQGRVDAVGNLQSWVAGTANQIGTADDGDGSITLALSSTLVTPGTLTVTGHATPQANNTYDLGSDATAWRTVTAYSSLWYGATPISLYTQGAPIKMSGGGAGAYDVVITPAAAGVGKLTNGANACEWRVHGDATKYVSLSHSGSYGVVATGASGGNLILGAESSLDWYVAATGHHFLPNSDNAVDFGGASNKVRDVHVGGAIIGAAGTYAGPTIIFGDTIAMTRSTSGTRGLDVLDSGSAYVRLVDGSQASFGILVAASSHIGWNSGAFTQSGSSSPDTLLFRDGAGQLGQRNGANAQKHGWYDTYTNASNYERVVIECGTTYTALKYETAGTGAAQPLYVWNSTSSQIVFRTGAIEGWQINASGHLLTGDADNTYDIGASGATRPRAGYFGTAIAVGTNPADAGGIRVQNDVALNWRNAANNGNITAIYVTSGNRVTVADGNVACLVVSGSGGSLGFLSTTPVAAKTGWGAATGTATRTTFATTTVTLEELAQRVKALIDDLHQTAGYGLLRT